MVYMGVQLGGTGGEDDPLIILGAVLDQPFVSGHVDLQRREDLQLWSALHALACIGAARHPLGVRTGDKPDRELVHKDRVWATELTQLTVDHLQRQDLAQARKFARRLRLRIQARSAEYPHLRGRVVTITKQPDAKLPKNDGRLLSELERALEENRGFLGEGQDLSHGLPEKLGERGLYGVHGPFDVTVHLNPGSNEIAVSPSGHFPVHRSEAIAALAKRVAAKDHPRNEVLIVSCSAPDEFGFVCVADQSIFQLLWDARQSGVDILPEKPAHIQGILIHSWNSRYLFHWQSSNDLPWHT